MVDLIKRTYVLAEYDRQHKGPPGGARKIMEEAPAVNAVPVVQRWISVKDRMPDNDAICLVCGKKGGMRVARAFVGKTYSWWTIVGTGKYFNATHWMPLPEPPKMDGEADG